jgi:hypothetical protein
MPDVARTPALADNELAGFPRRPAGAAALAIGPVAARFDHPGIAIGQHELERAG